MQRDTLKTVVETHVKNANGDVNLGLKSFNSQMQEAVSKGVTLETVSITNLFEAMVEPYFSVDKTSVSSVRESVTAAGLPTLVGSLLHPVFMAQYTPLTANVLQLCSETTSTRRVETIPGLTANDNLHLVGEATQYEESQPGEKYASITNYKFGRMISLTLESILFDQTGLVVDAARKIGIKAGTHLHTFIVQKATDIACTITGEAANTSLKIGGSTRTMFADTHATWDQVNDNLGGTALGTTGLKEALLLLAGMKDEKGDLIMIMPKHILVPAALEVTAKQLLQSPMAFDGTSSSGTWNAVNVFQNSLQLVVSPIIDSGVSASAYYVGDFSQQLRLQWVWKPKTDVNTNPATGFASDTISQYKISYFAGCGCTDYRFVVKANT